MSRAHAYTAHHIQDEAPPSGTKWLTATNFVALASAPSGPTEGWVYYDTTVKTITIWDGSQWRGLLTTGAVDDAEERVIMGAY